MSLLSPDIFLCVLVCVCVFAQMGMSLLSLDITSLLSLDITRV